MFSARTVMPPAMSAKMRRVSVTVSTASNSGSLSSWLSLLYASGCDFIRVRRLISCPYTRPVLPRASSGTSGFFFCGMIEEPVQKRSAIWMKPTRGLIHITSSSDRRLMCIIKSAQAEVNSMAKSRSETASSEFSQTPSKPSSAATNSRSIG